MSAPAPPSPPGRRRKAVAVRGASPRLPDHVEQARRPRRGGDHAGDRTQPKSDARCHRPDRPPAGRGSPAPCARIATQRQRSVPRAPVAMMNPWWSTFPAQKLGEREGAGEGEREEKALMTNARAARSPPGARARGGSGPRAAPPAPPPRRAARRPRSRERRATRSGASPNAPGGHGGVVERRPRIRNALGEQPLGVMSHRYPSANGLGRIRRGAGAVFLGGCFGGDPRRSLRGRDRRSRAWVS